MQSNDDNHINNNKYIGMQIKEKHLSFYNSFWREYFTFLSSCNKIKFNTEKPDNKIDSGNIENLFTFHNVGQGLFYSGKIFNYNFIYDCGQMRTISSSKKGYFSAELIQAIDYYKQNILKQNRIDFIAISHFDQDHFNGIEYLVKNKKPKLILLPYFPEIMYEKIGIFCSILYFTGVNYEYTETIFNYYSKGVVVDNNIDDLNELSKFVRDNETKTIIIKGNIKICVKKLMYENEDAIDWIFQFFNNHKVFDSKDIKSLISGFEAILKKNNITDFSKKINSNILSSIKKEYDTLLKSKKININQTSLVMYHYPLTTCGDYIFENVLYDLNPHNFDYFYQEQIKNQNPLFLYKIYPPIGTLLSGDIDYSKTCMLPLEINNVITEANLSNKVCNIPHHGAFDEYIPFKMLIKNFNSDFIMNFGYYSNWPDSFPNKTTISDSNKYYNNFIPVYESISFSYSICFAQVNINEIATSTLGKGDDSEN